MRVSQPLALEHPAFSGWVVARRSRAINERCDVMEKSAARNFPHHVTSFKGRGERRRCEDDRVLPSPLHVEASLAGLFDGFSPLLQTNLPVKSPGYGAVPRSPFPRRPVRAAGKICRTFGKVLRRL